MNVISLARTQTRRYRSWLLALVVLAAAAYLGRRPSAMVLFLTAAGIGLAVLLRYPRAGLIMIVATSFTVPFMVNTGTEVSLTFPILLVPVLAVVWALTSWRKDSAHLPRSRTYAPMLAFLGAGLFSLLAGNATWDPTVPRPAQFIFVQVAQWAIWAASVAAYVLTASWGAQHKWLKTALFLFFGLATEVMVELLLPPLRSVPGWSSPLYAYRSMFWVWLCAMALGQAVFNSDLSWAVRGWLLALVVAALSQLVMRDRDWISGWGPASLATASLLWLWVSQRGRRWAVVFGIILMIAFVSLRPAIFEYAGGEVELQVSGGGRMLLYRAVLDTVQGHEVFGLGPAAYRQYGFMHPLTAGFGTAYWVRPLLNSHNNYIDIYAQVGIVGLLIFVWLLVEIGVNAWRFAHRPLAGFEKGYAMGTLVGFIGTLVAMLLADWFLPFVYNISFPGLRTSILAWVFLGGLVALQAQGEHPPQSEVRPEE